MNLKGRKKKPKSLEEAKQRLKELLQKKEAFLKETTLLFRFIEGKRGAYIEPQRQGTPRGEPIGFSKEKYHASLLMMVKEKGPVLAKLAEVSYGVLRLWKIEPAFQKQVARNKREFVSRFMERMEQRIREQQKAYQEWMKKSVEEIAKGIAKAKQIGIGWEEFRDAQSYSDDLMAMIGFAILERIKRLNPEDPGSLLIASEYSATLDILGYFRGIPKDPKEEQRKKELSDPLEGLIFRGLQSTLMKPRISEEERKEAVFALSVLRKARK